jgi:hypothetical protein
VHTVTCQKTTVFTSTTVRTSDLKCYPYSLGYYGTDIMNRIVRVLIAIWSDPNLKTSFLGTQSVFIALLRLIPLPWYSKAPHFIIRSPPSSSLGSNTQVLAHWEELDFKAGDFLLEQYRYRHASRQGTTASRYHLAQWCTGFFFQRATLATVLCLWAEQYRIYKEQSNLHHICLTWKIHL